MEKIITKNHIHSVSLTTDEHNFIKEMCFSPTSLLKEKIRDLRETFNAYAGKKLSASRADIAKLITFISNKGMAEEYALYAKKTNVLEQKTE